MYTSKFPIWEDAIALGNKAYSGNFAYAYAKRGQILLCEKWAAAHPKVRTRHSFLIAVTRFYLLVPIFDIMSLMIFLLTLF